MLKSTCTLPSCMRRVTPIGHVWRAALLLLFTCVSRSYNMLHSDWQHLLQQLVSGCYGLVTEHCVQRACIFCELFIACSASLHALDGFVRRLCRAHSRAMLRSLKHDCGVHSSWPEHSPLGTVIPQCAQAHPNHLLVQNCWVLFGQNQTEQHQC